MDYILGGGCPVLFLLKYNTIAFLILILKDKKTTEGGKENKRKEKRKEGRREDERKEGGKEEKSKEVSKNGRKHPRGTEAKVSRKVIYLVWSDSQCFLNRFPSEMTLDNP